MKNVLLYIAFLLMVMPSCQSAKEVYLFSTFREPADKGLFLAYSFDGLNWEDLGGPWLAPEVGTQKVMRDPSVVSGPDGTFHMVWTSSWRGDLGFGYASTKDFINWSPQQLIPVMDFDTSTVNVWAPELFYDQYQKEYIIIWASTIPYKFERGIEAEDNNHRMYYTTTRDFQNFSETKLFIDPKFSVIDAVIVERGIGDYVLVLKDNTRPERNLKVAFGPSPLGPYKNISEPFTGQFTEGPTLIRKDDAWYIYYDAYELKRYGLHKTTDFIHFEDVSDQVKLPEGHKHGTIFKADRRLLKNLIKANKKAK
ncbi:glycoside hydrolase family 43 protein [Flavilitoribacter nigricans]|uniref:Arabinosidase n=1 Tax=Flavilitoribacter nigricans (strain ATCC 23147 / DSM 23189 / NBRC 102662 / NCIMB 1420 / SS-2) TaxID=1122177 RepID=A0A2D0N216_FLAN2|nr:glycoside hydrolase family 43 protein [Flavilitoribacter nigricans]PHN02438.1 arabinosidase [Flavilitoribacter nigricans DSM 23189 = NBRC 102662]